MKMINVATRTINTATRTRSAMKSALVRLDQIDFPANARPAHADKVNDLVGSIRLLGLQYSPTVIERDGRYVLVSGRHRVEAMRVIGKEPIPVRIVDFDDVEARLWAISENLHRNELNALQRAEQIAEYAKLTKERLEVQKQEPSEVRADAAKVAPQAAQSPAGDQSAQGGQFESKRADGRGHRKEGGDSFAARDLGITRQEVQRSQAIAALPAEVKAKAADLGLDRNQSALLQAAKATTREAQISTLEQRAVRPVAPLASRPSSLRNLENLAAGEFARWIKETTPNDRLRVIRMLKKAADILEVEMHAEPAA
jgi:ParB-like chromosome segregation protein Spo0J